MAPNNLKMNGEKNNKKCLTKPEINRNAMVGNPVSNDARNEPITGPNEPSTSEAAPPPYDMGKSDVIVPKTTQDVHLGPQNIVLEAVHLDSIKRSDVINVNDMCKSCEKEKEERSFRGRLKKVKNDWTIKRCYLLAILIVVIEIFLLAFLYCTKDKTKENGPYFIDPSRIGILHNNLIRFKLREDRDLVDKNDCAYQCPKLKSKIRFILLPLHHFNCTKLPSNIESYNKKLYVYQSFLIQRTLNYYYKDIYYNYLIFGPGRRIREGRSLTCPHEETVLEEDHTEMITVGIEDCYPEISVTSSGISLHVIDRISDLITNMKEKQMLTTDFVLDFPDICNGSHLLERVINSGIGNISFYKHEFYKNLKLSSLLDPSTISNLFFSPEVSLQNHTRSNPSAEIIHKFPDISHYCRVSSISANKVTIRFYFDNFRNESLEEAILKKCNWTVKMDDAKQKECFQRMRMQLGLGVLYKNSEKFLSENNGNLFTFLVSDSVYGPISLNCSPDINQTNFVVNIIYIQDNVLQYYDALPIGQRFRHVMESIGNYVRKTIKYSQVEYTEFCPFKMYEWDDNLGLVYQYFAPWEH